MQRKLRAADALLFAPILLIGSVGYRMQQRGQNVYDSTRIEVRDLKILPPKPNDVARGFDTRVRVKLGYLGVKPRGWGVAAWPKPGDMTYSLTRIFRPTVLQPDKSAAQNIDLYGVENHFDASDNVYVGTYLLKLQDVPSDASVMMNGSFAPEQLTQPNTASLPESMPDSAASNWHVVVRPQGTTTPPPPRVSHFTGLELQRITLNDQRKRSGKLTIFVDADLASAVTDKELLPRKYQFQNTTPLAPRPLALLGDIYLSNDKGQKFECFGHSTIQTSPFEGISPENGKPFKTSGHLTLSFDNWQNLPVNIDNLNFYVRLSTDDLWPLEINIPVKDIPRES